MNIDHILVTTDLSEEALRPCSSIGEIARSRGARVTLLHVVEDYTAIPHGAPMAPAQPSPGVHDRLDKARAELAEQRRAFGDCPVELDVIAGEDVAKTIAEYAERKGVDLIAASTHGRTGFRALVMGSVTEALIRHSQVPVLVFPRGKD